MKRSESLKRNKEKSHSADVKSIMKKKNRPRIYSIEEHSTSNMLDIFSFRKDPSIESPCFLTPNKADKLLKQYDFSFRKNPSSESPRFLSPSKMLEEEEKDVKYKSIEKNQKKASFQNDKRVCPNCNFFIPIPNFSSHSKHCESIWDSPVKPISIFIDSKQRCQYCNDMVQDLYQHWQTCEFMRVMCQYCKAIVTRGEKKNHEERCVYDFCQHCGKKVHKKNYYKHLNECKAFEKYPNTPSKKMPSYNKQIKHAEQQPKAQKKQKHPNIPKPRSVKLFENDEPTQEPKKGKSKSKAKPKESQPIEEQYEADPLNEGILNISELTEIQNQVIQFFTHQSLNSHHEYDRLMQIRLKQQNYSSQDLERIRKYIQLEAPIIIHFNMSKSLEYFYLDGCYKNLFETNTSGGLNCKRSRQKYEHYLFNGMYDNAQNGERVKYGVMNFVNDYMGVRACKQYGSSFFVLKPHVRKRCTLTNTRLYGPGQTITTLQYCNAVLSKFTKAELWAIYNASMGYSLNSNKLPYFKQVHIHGFISFFDDVEAIFAPSKEINKNRSLLQKFKKKYMIQCHPKFSID